MIVAADFFTVEVWTRRGLERFLILFFIDLSTRKVEIAGIAQAANGLWMSQIARHLTDVEPGILTGKRYLIHDRDPLFTAEFLSIIAAAGVESVKLPPRSPNLKSPYSQRTHASAISGRLLVIVLEQPTQSLLASNASLGTLQGSRPRKQ